MESVFKPTRGGACRCPFDEQAVSAAVQRARYVSSLSPEEERELEEMAEASRRKREQARKRSSLCRKQATWILVQTVPESIRAENGSAERNICWWTVIILSLHGRELRESGEKINI